MTQPKFRKPTQADVAHIAANMRPEDVRDCALADGSSPMDALLQSTASSSVALCAVVDDKPVAIFGYAEQAPTTACVWMLGTPDIPRRLLSSKYVRGILDCWGKQYATLYNLVPRSSTDILRWLRALGFRRTCVYLDHGPQRVTFDCMAYHPQCVKSPQPH